MLINGKAFWAKIVGSPVPGFDKNDPKAVEWSFDLSINKDVVKQLKADGLGAKIKNKGDERGDYIRLKRKGIKNDGNPAKAIQIFDAHGEVWGNELIGNGSELNVNVAIEDGDYHGKKYRTMKPISVQVWDHVKYVPKSPFPTKTEEAPASTGEKKDW